MLHYITVDVITFVSNMQKKNSYTIHIYRPMSHYITVDVTKVIIVTTDVTSNTED